MFLFALTRRQTASGSLEGLDVCMAGSVVTLQDNLLCQKQSRMGLVSSEFELSSAHYKWNDFTRLASVSPRVM